MRQTRCSSLHAQAVLLEHGRSGYSDHALAYDPQAGYLHIDYYGDSGHLEHAWVDSKASSCRANPGVGKAIAHAEDAARDLKAGDCAQFKSQLK